MDFFLDGQGYGDVATRLAQNGHDPGALRPWIDDKTGRTFITLNKNGKASPRLVHNAPGTLRYQEWLMIDELITKVAKPRLRVFGDLRAAGSSYTLPNGMAKSVLMTERQSDISGADISMDAIRETNNDNPLYDNVSLPLPIISKDFHITSRQLEMSRNGQSPLDLTTAELATRRVAEEVEKLTLGTRATYNFAGLPIYGYTNFPQRLTHTITSPTAGGWTPNTLLNEILAMRLQSQLSHHYGPWMVYNSPAWDQYLDNDFKTYSGITLRQRLEQIQGIAGVRTADYLDTSQGGGTGYTIVMVQMTPDVARAVVGMDIMTVQWETHGGMRINFKVMCMLIPQVRCDQNNQTGLIHGDTNL